FTAEPTTTLPPCSTERHVVAFDYFGTVSVADEELGAWLEDTTNPPDARPGVAGVAAAYRARGYELLYITTAPEEIKVGETPIRDAITGWLTEQGFPLDAGTSLWVWDGNFTPMEGVTAELDRLVGEGATIDAAYTDNEDKAFAFKTSVPSERVFTLGTGAATTGTTPIPGDDMTAHVATVEQLAPVCQSG
ncbi:MAG TPA: hypothetical protein VFI47_16050, partial [Acidimicrobiales bacterium]|nr:hypothetical protein [Acidimicrobiales bacterium]